MPKVSIVIPYWNGVEKIKKHLPAVLKFARDNRVEEVIASDDASTDETVELLKNQFPDVVVIQRKENAGFASNVNSGFARASGDYIFLLNSDASPDKELLKFALPHFQRFRVFSVGCNTGGLWAVARFENGFFYHNQASADMGDPTKAHQTLWASGGSGIFRKGLWDEMKGMDELYDPFYVEDVDLGYRATKRGYINIWEPNSKVEHYKEKGVIIANFSKSTINYITERNMLIFIWKNITSKEMMRDHKRYLVKRIMAHPKYTQIVVSALLKLPRIISKRKAEMKVSKLTDEEVFGIFNVY